MSDTAETAAEKQRGRPFKKGISGNPSGRPIGARNKATVAMEALLDSEAEAITRKAVELALKGEATAMRLCLERLLPPRKERPVSFTLPPIENAADAVKAAASLLRAVADGSLTIGEATELGKLVESYVKTLEATEFEERLNRLEQRTAQ